jgi:hypothetical protein
MPVTEQQERMNDDIHQRVLDAILAALEEIDDGVLSEPLLRTPETVLVGEGGLESLAFVTFAVTLEERLQAAGLAVSVFDVLPQDLPSCTAEQLAVRIGEAVEARVR